MKFSVLLSVLWSCTSLSSQDDATIRVKQNDVFTVVLPSSIGTGYSWQLADSLDKRHLTFVSQRYVEGKDLDGGEGKEQFKFKALKKGKSTLRFRYVRSWEKSIPKDTPYQAFSILIF